MLREHYRELAHEAAAADDMDGYVLASLASGDGDLFELPANSWGIDLPPECWVAIETPDGWRGLLVATEDAGPRSLVMVPSKALLVPFDRALATANDLLIQAQRAAQDMIREA